MSGCFRVYQNQDNTRDIHFEQILLTDGTTVPDDQLELRDNVDKALTVINMLFTSDEIRFQEYYRQLLSLAQLGLVGPSANPKLAQRALSTLKDDIVSREGSRVKNNYMMKLGKTALLIGLPAVILAIIIMTLFASLVTISSYLFMWTGCMGGAWLSFGARKLTITFEDLNILEKDRMNPIIRLIFAGLLTIVIGLLLSTKAITFEMGGLSTETITSNAQVALLIGFLCGVSEQALSAKVSQHAYSLLNIK